MRALVSIRGGLPMPATSRKRRSTSRSKSNRSGMDAIALLKKDHQTVRRLLKKLASSAETRRSEAVTVLRQIENELKVHTQIEEEIFYPAFREAVEGKEEEHIYYEALE